MNILAEFKALKDKVAALVSDQSKATVASITDLSTKLTLLETETLAKLESATASVKELGEKLAKASTDLSAATGHLDTIKNALTAAATALKLDLTAAAGPVEMIAALQGAVATTLAKLDVPAGSIPAPKPQDVNRPAGGKSMTLKEFTQMTPQQRMAFAKEVNLGTAKLVE